MNQEAINENLLRIIKLEGQRIDSLYEMIKSLEKMVEVLKWAIDHIAVIPSQFQKESENEKVICKCGFNLIIDGKLCYSCIQKASKSESPQSP